MSKKIAVILSGCGVYDGAEIHESVITLLRLDQRGAQVECFAPDVAQLHVINHLTGEEMPESRNVLVESARIARGTVKDIGQANAADFDALIVPGGFGAAKNLSDFAIKGAECTVQPDVLALAESDLGEDPGGYRHAFLNLVRNAQALIKEPTRRPDDSIKVEVY